LTDWTMEASVNNDDLPNIASPRLAKCGFVATD